MKVRISKPLVMGTGKSFDTGDVADLPRTDALHLIQSHLATPEATRKHEDAMSKKVTERRMG